MTEITPKIHGDLLRSRTDLSANRAVRAPVVRTDS